MISKKIISILMLASSTIALCNPGDTQGKSCHQNASSTLPSTFKIKPIHAMSNDGEKKFSGCNEQMLSKHMIKQQLLSSSPHMIAKPKDPGNLDRLAAENDAQNASQVARMVIHGPTRREATRCLFPKK